MHIYYCVECIDKIYSHFEVFHRVCSTYLMCEAPLEICLDHEETKADAIKLMKRMRMLELIGYVVTTEIGKSMMAIKPLGLTKCDTDKGAHSFCLVGDHVKQSV